MKVTNIYHGGWHETESSISRRANLGNDKVLRQSTAMLIMQHFVEALAALGGITRISIRALTVPRGHNQHRMGFRNTGYRSQILISAAAQIFLWQMSY